MEEKNFKGLPYPIEKHPRGYLRTQWGVNQIKSDLLILLLTSPGERVMLPDFGTPLRRLFFEPADTILIQEARELIINALNAWEPRVAVQNVDVWIGTELFTDGAVDPEQTNIPEDEEHILGIKITFVDPQNIKKVEELVLKMPIGGV